MTSAVIVNLDTKVKKRAMKRAKTEGIPLSAVIKSAVRAYAEGTVEFGLVETVNAKTLKRFEKAEHDFLRGKNISTGFTTVAQARKYLDNR